MASFDGCPEVFHALYLEREHYRRPARLSRPVLLYPTAAGADLLPVTGKPGEEAAGEK